MPSRPDDLWSRPEIAKIISMSVKETISNFTRQNTSAEAPRAEGLVEKPACVGIIRIEEPRLAIELLLALPQSTLDRLSSGLNTPTSNGFSNDNNSGSEMDLAGEVLNIAFGNIDPQLRAMGFAFKSSFPKTFTKPQLLTIVRDLPRDSIRVPMQAGGEPLDLIIFPGGSIHQKWVFTPA